MGWVGTVCAETVYPVATYGMASLSQVNANLVCATRLQPTGQQRVAIECFSHLDVRDGLFADTRKGRAAPPTVSAVADEAAHDAPARLESRNDRQVASGDRVTAKLETEPTFRQRRAGQDQEAARGLVEPMHNAQMRQRRPGRTAFVPVDECGQQVLQGRIQGLASFGDVSFRRVAHRREAGGFLNHDDLVVQMADANVRAPAGPGRGLGQHFNRLPRLQSPHGIKTQVIPDPDAAAVNQPAHFRPRVAPQVLAEYRGKGATGQFRRNAKAGSGQGYLGMSFGPILTPRILYASGEQASRHERIDDGVLINTLDLHDLLRALSHLLKARPIGERR